MADRKPEPEWEPGTWDELFPGRFLKHSHLGTREVEVTIERVYNTTIDDKLAQVARIAPVHGIEQRDWGLNKTNGLCLRAMFGDAIKRDWTGKRVTLKSSVVEHGREKGKPCIRICASADIPADQTVVIDFHTKRIKPFPIRIRATGKGKAQPSKQEASEKARELAQRFRSSATTAELSDIMNDLELALEADPPTVTKQEASDLIAAISKKEKDLKTNATT
jgi:hypothetical protein